MYEIFYISLMFRYVYGKLGSIYTKHIDPMSLWGMHNRFGFVVVVRFKPDCNGF